MPGNLREIQQNSNKLYQEKNSALNIHIHGAESHPVKKYPTYYLPFFSYLDSRREGNLASGPKSKLGGVREQKDLSPWAYPFAQTRPPARSRAALARRQIRGYDRFRNLTGLGQNITVPKFRLCLYFK